MQIYLPVAETSVSLLSLVGIGTGVGFLSGLFGVGGGFLLTPLLFFIGIPPAVAVATGGNHVVGSSFSGMLSHWKRKAVDVRMGFMLLIGGVIGSALGVLGFNILRKQGQFDLVVAVFYVLLLGGVGTLMAVEGVKAIRAAKRPRERKKRQRAARRPLAQRLPFQMRFRQSKLVVSALAPMGIGAAIGFLSALLGVGGGFIMIPAMIYFLRMPTNVVVGTSLFQITFMTAFATVLHAATNKTVDVVLAVVLLLGGVIGAQIGARFGSRIRGDQMRLLLALIILAVAAKLLFDLVAPPGEPFSIQPSKDLR